MGKKAVTLMACGLGFISVPMQVVLAANENSNGEYCKDDGKSPDYSVVQPTNGFGIDVFSTTSSGVKLLKGSPFVPNPVPTGLGGPVSTPSLVTVNAEQTHVYGLYEFIFGPSDLLWSFKLTPGGLKQEDSITFPFGGGGPHGESGAYILGAKGHLVYIVNTMGFAVILKTFMTLYKVDDGHFKSSSQISFSEINGPNFQTLSGPETVHIDAEEHFLFACFPNGELILDSVKTAFSQTLPSVAVYHLKDGAPTFVVNSTNADYVQSKCP